MIARFVAPLALAFSLSAGAALAAPTFRIDSLGLNVTGPVEHSVIGNVYSDDRGGLAVSPTNVFYTGDGNGSGNGTEVFDLNLGGAALTGTQLDGIFNNVRNGDVWALGTSATTPYSGVFNGAQTATHILKINGATGVPTGESLALSSSITIPGYSCCNSRPGIYSGYDRVLIQGSDGTVRKVDLATGAVSAMGTVAISAYTYSESWANWGIAEVFGGDEYLVYRSNQDSNEIRRTRISDGQISVLASFTNLGDLYNIAVSPSQNRWYFHWEGGNQFGGNDESIAYASASFTMTPDSVPEPATVALFALGAAGIAAGRRRRRA